MSLTEKVSPLVMVKHFGVSLAQAQRVQALLRLGVTEQDVQIAERLMSSTPAGEADNSAKIEWLLGCSVEQMSRLKALEVLGISSAMLEEEKARILGSLGVKAWSNLGSSAVIEHPQDSVVDSCLSRKRRNTAPEEARVPAPVCGMAVPSPSEVAELEDECLSQHLRIQQLELQVAALSLSESYVSKDKGQG